ncbi:MAG: ATP-binding protein [Eggerthellaceae bacterium]|nr:ATP-binding protein [Eggerthellaceae bacterium]
MDNHLIERPRYLSQLVAFQDRDLIKVVTGIRRCGKSSLLKLMQEELRRQGVADERIIIFKMESMEFDGLDYQGLHSLILKRIGNVERPYLFFDDVQEVAGWERAVNALRVDVDCDIYITGSNAHLLSSELSTLISGRYVEVEMLPLTFSEYLAFRGYERGKGESSGIAFGKGGQPAVLPDLFGLYRRFGGFPFLALAEPEIEEHRAYMKTLYDSVIVRDILGRDRRGGQRRLTSSELLERTCAFLADNAGNSNSVKSIADAIRAGGLSAANDTVDAYTAALCDAYLFYPARRFDIKGKELLKTNGKHYVVDTGLRNYLAGYRDADQGRMLENIVFHQLCYEGFDVHVGSLRAGDVDFVATRGSERLYVQVTDNMEDKSTYERELAPLRSIRDAHPKLVVTGSGSYPADEDGIRIVDACDFLLSAERSR